MPDAKALAWIADEPSGLKLIQTTDGYTLAKKDGTTLPLSRQEFAGVMCLVQLWQTET